MEAGITGLLKNGLALAPSDSDTNNKDTFVPSILISVIQHLSDNPWVTLDLSAKSFLGENQIEWDWLTDGVDKSRKTKFWTELKQAAQLEDCKHGLFVIRRYFQKDFHLSFVRMGEDSAPIIFQRFHLSSKEMKSEDFTAKPLDFYEKYQNADEKIFILFEGNQSRRLISSIQKLYPTKQQLGEKLVDIFGQIGIFRFTENTSLDNMENMNSATELLNGFRRKIERLNQSKSFSEILNQVLPNGYSEYPKLIQEFMELEKSLDRKDLCELRIKLIQLITIELYHPIRQAIIVQKEKQQRICIEAAEKHELLAVESMYLQNNIEKQKEELDSLDIQVCQLNEDIKSVELSRQSKKSELIAQLSEMEEKEAFNQFIKDITNYDPTKSMEVLSSLKDLNYNELPVYQLLQALVRIFEIPPSNQKLLNRISKQVESDRKEIIQTLEVLRQIPLMDIDSEGDIFIQGNNIMLSFILPQILQSVETRKPSQLKIVCQESFVLDTPLEKKYFSGMNIVLIANNVIAADAEITIDVSGTDGHSHEEKADDGAGDGADGQNGLDGIDGTHGGDVYIEALTSIVNEGNIQIDCKGGNGGNGQDGGNGTDGRPGKDGENGNLSNPAWFEKYWAIAKGSEGAPGEEGGAKGLGGRAGAAGISGKAYIVINGKPREIPYEGAKEGKTGKDGTCGQNGLHGQKGMDHGRAAMYMFQGWETKTGYDLGIKEIKGWVYNGYELLENLQPEKQKTQQSTRHNTREKKSKMNTNKKSEVNKQTIATMKAHLLKMKGETVDWNKPAQTSANLKEELSHLSDSPDISKNLKEVKQLQKLRNSANDSLIESKTKQNSILEAMSKAKEEKIQAELRSKLFEQVAQKFKESQAEDLLRATQYQHQAQMEIQSENMVMVDKTAFFNYQEDPRKKTAKVTNALANIKHNDIYKLYLELSEKLGGNFEAISCLECAMQIVEESISDYEKVFHKVCQNSDYLNYIKIHLVEDTKAAYEFREIKLNLPGICGSLLDYFVKFRVRQTNDEISHINKKNSEFCSFIKSLEVDTKAKQVLADWKDPKKVSEESIFTKLPEDLRNEFKQTIIDQGKLIYCERVNAFNNWSQTPEGFLLDLIKYCESQKEVEFLQGELLSAFLKQTFKYVTLSSVLHKMLNAGAAINKNGVKGRSFEDIQVLTEAKFVLTHVHFKLDELSEISGLVSRLKTQDDLSEFANLVDELVGIIQAQYKNNTTNVISNIKMEIEKFQPEMIKRVSNLFEKTCSMLDSNLHNLPYPDRMKYLENIQTEVTLNNLTKVSQDLYPLKSDECIDTGELKFANFHSSLVRELFQRDLVREKLNQMLLCLQVGKLSTAGILDFSKQELVLLENSLWETLFNVQGKSNYKERVQFIHKFQEQIEQSKSLEFNTYQLEIDCDVDKCRETFSKLLKRTLAYIPRGDTESTITDAYKKRSQLKYLFLRAEYVTIKSCTCSRVEELDGILFNTAINEVDEIIAKVESWVNQQESTLSDFAMKNDETRLEFLQRQKSNLMQEGEIEYDLIFRSGLRHCSVLNDSEILEEENKVLSEIVKKLCGDLKPDMKDPSKLKRVKHLFTFIQTREPGYHPMQNLQQMHSQSYQSQLKRWRDVQKLLRKATQILHSLKGSSQKEHTSTPLYLCAKFSEAVDRKIVHELKLHNIKRHSDELDAIFRSLTNVTVEMDCEEQVQIGKVARMLQAKAVGYPFTKEFITLLLIEVPERSKRNLKIFTFLDAILNNAGLKTQKSEWPSLWNKLTTMFTNFESSNMYKSKYLKFHLAEFLVKLKYEDARTPLLIRMIQKVLEYKDKNKKDIRVDCNLEPTLKSSDLYSILIPKFKVEQIFINDKETKILREISKLDLEGLELKNEIKCIICLNHPMKWQGLLERLYFNKTFKVFAAPSSQNLEERDSWKDIDFLAKVNHKGKRILRAIQQTHVYNEFKLSYLLQENESGRIRWLITFNKMLKKLNDGQEVFSSVTDCKTFLTFIRDIDIDDFEEIVENRFPQNWLKWVLIKCLEKDIDKLPGAPTNEGPKETLLKVLVRF